MAEGVVCLADMDFCFGWRWLLPLRDRERVALIGFSEHEVVFWKEVLADSNVVDDVSKATVLLVQDLPAGSFSHFDSNHLYTICVVGSGKIVASWHKWMDRRCVNKHVFALLPPGKPRVVVPLGRADWLVQALALHRPGRGLARWAVSLIKALARLGFDLFLRSRVLYIANKSINTLPQGARQAGLKLDENGAPRAFALYLGIPEENRKTVVLPLGGAQQVILKCAESPKGKKAIRREAEVLNALGQTSLASQVPALLGVVEQNNQLTLCMEYRVRKAMSKAGLEEAAVSFLTELSRLDRCLRPLATVLDQLNNINHKEAKLMEACAVVKERLDILAASGVTVWGHRSHGDFAPWNCAWTDKGFFVFDWEESRAWDLALSDAFYFVTAPAVHVTRSPNPKAVEITALALAGKVAKYAGLPIENIRIYLALWLLMRLNQKPAPLYEQLLERLVISWH